MATIRVVIVDPDGTVRKSEIENDLGSFQAIVGGYVEAVCGSNFTVYVNEEGIYENLPFNPSASLFVERFRGVGVRLFGTAVILGPPDEEGRDTDVQQSVVDYYNLEG